MPEKRGGGEDSSKGRPPSQGLPLTFKRSDQSASGPPRPGPDFFRANDAPLRGGRGSLVKTQSSHLYAGKAY